jgi:DNA-binding winged helix-turn-helix (wHTH) protein
MVPRMASRAIPERKSALVFGNLEIRPDELQALAKGVRVGLTVREFQVLLVLARREDHVVRRTDIYDQVWGGEMKQRDRSVDVFVRKLRQKLEKASPRWRYIHTHFGIGYRFAAESLDEIVAQASSEARAAGGGPTADTADGTAVSVESEIEVDVPPSVPIDWDPAHSGDGSQLAGAQEEHNLTAGAI